MADPLYGAIDITFEADPTDPLRIEKGDLLGNTWYVDTEYDGLTGLEAQVHYWRERLEEDEPEHLEAFDAFVAERVAPFYPGVVYS
jgi:hypothetical protein